MEGTSSFQNFSTGNFDPNQIVQQTSAVIQFVVVLDVSPSIHLMQDSMNKSLEDLFMQELKNCHRKDDIMVKCILFSDTVTHKSGFQPILNLPNNYLEVKAQGSGTALYDATLAGMSEAIAYREDLELQGIDVRTAIFICTDGEDNRSKPNSAGEVVKLVEGLRSNEAWINSFSITMLGVGQEVHFKAACKKMGLDPDKCLVTISDSAEEIRKAFGVVSQSISSGSQKKVTF